MTTVTKIANRVVGVLLVVDVAVLAFVWIVRKDYFFPGRYETAYGITAYGLLFALLVGVVYAVRFFISLARDSKEERNRNR